MSKQMNEPAPISWEEAMNQVQDRYSQRAEAVEDERSSQFAISSGPWHPWNGSDYYDYISEWCPDEPSAWLSAHSRLGGAEQPKECGVENDDDGFCQLSKGHEGDHSAPCSTPDLLGRIYVTWPQAPAVPAPPVLSPSETGMSKQSEFNDKFTREFNKVLEVRRSGLQLCDLAGDDFDMVYALYSNGMSAQEIGDML